MTVVLRDIREADWPAFYMSVLAENGRRESVAAARRMAGEAASRFMEAIAGEAARPISELSESDTIGPGEKFAAPTGAVFENVSGAWLSPFSAGPGEYPAGWKRVDGAAPPVASVPEWSGDSVSYSAGDLCSYGGVVYKVVQGHVSQPGWQPTVAFSLFAVN